MDQATQMLDLNAHRNLGISDGITGSRISHDMGNGYSAESSVTSVGISFVADNGMIVSGGGHRVNTDITGADSTGNNSTTVLSLGASKHIDDKGVTVSGTINNADSDLSYSRTIGDFAAAGENTANDKWANVKIEKSAGGARPFAGLTFGNKTADAWDETGDVQATLSHAATDEKYRFATLGVNIDTGLITASIAKDFGDSEAMHMGVGIEKDINDRFNIGASVNRTQSGDNTSTMITAGINIKF